LLVEQVVWLHAAAQQRPMQVASRHASLLLLLLLLLATQRSDDVRAMLDTFSAFANDWL